MNRPMLSERYGPDNPGKTAEEQNLFAQGALWWGEVMQAKVDELTRQLDDARTKAIGVFVSTEGDESRLSHALNDTCEFCGHDGLDGGVCWSCFQNWPKPVADPNTEAYVAQLEERAAGVRLSES